MVAWCIYIGNPQRPVSPVSAPVAPPAPSAASNVPTKPTADDLIAPVGTAYTPVSLPAPKKLKNPFAAFEQEQASPPQSRFGGTSQAGGAKKLTWSERQALAKKQAEEDEAKSRSSGFVAPTASPIPKPVFTSSAPAFGRATGPQSTPRNFGAVGVAAGVSTAAGATVIASQYSDNIASAKAAVQEAAWGRDEEEEQSQQEEEEEPAAPVSSTDAVVCTHLTFVSSLHHRLHRLHHHHRALKRSSQ